MIHGSKNIQTLKNIKVISLDVDDTLWDFESAMTSALGLTLQRIRHTVSTDAAMQLTVDEMINIRDAVSAQLGGDAAGVEKIRHAAFVKTLNIIGHPDREFATKLYELYMDARFSNVKPFADVPTALTQLANRFQLGIISNGNTHPVRLGLPNAFDFVVFAADCGYTKPDPASSSSPSPKSDTPRKKSSTSATPSKATSQAQATAASEAPGSTAKTQPTQQKSPGPRSPRLTTPGQNPINLTPTPIRSSCLCRRT